MIKHYWSEVATNKGGKVDPRFGVPESLGATPHVKSVEKVWSDLRVGNWNHG